MQIDRTSNDACIIVPVSVIIPCYRCADTIERAIDSVLAQTAMPAEIWVVDDASDDDGKTRDMLATLHDRYRDTGHLEVISLHDNCGPAVARNTAWEKATQPFLAFLDADDVWHPRKLEIQYGWMASHPSVALTGHTVGRFDENKDITLPLAKDIAGFQNVMRVTPHKLLYTNYFPTRSVMLRRELPYRFEPTKRRSEDYLLWLQIAFGGHDAWHIALPLASSFKAPYGEAGLTADLWRMEKAELDTYLHLYRQRFLSVVGLCSVSLFSLAKFARRWLIRLIRRHG